MLRMGDAGPPSSAHSDNEDSIFSSCSSQFLPSDIPQFDGNASLNSVSSDTVSSYISVIITSRSLYSDVEARLPPVRKTIRRSNRLLQAASLPKFSSYNMRSLMPKIHNFVLDFEDRMCQLSFLCEIWQKEDNKKHNFNIEELHEINGLVYIGTHRKGRRGGGVAMVANSTDFTCCYSIWIENCLGPS